MTITDPRAAGHDPPAPETDLPDAAALLDAVADFLEGDVRGAVADKGLGFRLLVAANLVRMVGRETRLSEAHDDAAFARFREVFPIAPTFPQEMITHRRHTLGQFRRALAERLRDEDDWPTEALGGIAALLRADLIDELAVVNPRFNTSLQIEAEGDA